MKANSARTGWQYCRAGIASFIVLLGAAERSAGWLAGATAGDFAKAFKNIQQWLANVPVLGEPKIQTAIFIVGVALLVPTWWFLLLPPRRQTQARALEDAQPNPQRQHQRMMCRRCEGTGKALQRSSFLRDHREICQICKGHGSFETDLWSQPDCIVCAGSGGELLFSMNGRRYWTECRICRGYGKRPYGV